MKEQVTGKQVLRDCAVLARDLGAYLFCLGARIVRAVKSAGSKKDDGKKA